jgi:hypothetical protein
MVGLPFFGLTAHGSWQYPGPVSRLTLKEAAFGKEEKYREGTTPRPEKAQAALPGDLLTDLRTLIGQTRQGIAQAVNSALVLLYWQVGQRIRADILKAKRAEYGEQILSTLSKELTAEFGRGYSRPNLSRIEASVKSQSLSLHERRPVHRSVKNTKDFHISALHPVDDDVG